MVDFETNGFTAEDRSGFGKYKDTGSDLSDNSNNNSMDLRSGLDPQFTEDISRQMRVPLQIRPYDDESPMLRSQSESFSRAAVQMNVPDRILVAGNERHVGYRENRPRELDFDDMLYGMRVEPSVLVQTPPRILTMNQYDFPVAAGSDADHLGEGPMIAPMSASMPSDSNLEMISPQQANRNTNSVQRLPRNYESALRYGGPVTQSSTRTGLPDTPASRLVIDLYKRVELLERENYHRYLREMVTYAALIGFIALKGMSYFLKR